MKAIDEDLFYRQIKEKSDLFWKVHQKDRQAFDPNFKDLFARMVASDPLERPKLQDILQHPWTQQEVASQNEIREEMGKRFDTIKQIHEKQEQEKIEERRVAAAAKKRRDELAK